MHERDLGTNNHEVDWPSRPFVSDQIFYHALARAYLLGIARNPAEICSDLMPKDALMTRAAKRLWDRLSEDDQQICCHFAGISVAHGTTPHERQKRFDPLVLELAMEARLVSRFSWIVNE